MHPYAQQIQKFSTKLEPKPTGIAPVLSAQKNIKACIFDIYGTLFMSGCGDISLVEGTNRDQILQEVLHTHQFSTQSTNLSNCFYNCIHRQQKIRRSEGIDYPEIEIRDVWKTFLKETGITNVEKEAIEHMAIDYECRVNPIWPMPNLQKTLKSLREKGILLGIVSNAQFFTPHLFETFTGKTIPENGFENDLCIYSYKLHIGKPSLKIYHPLIEALSKRSIKPQEALFVGNDLRNDVWPAQDVGMRGVLFAGDNRSLRLREDDSRSTKQPANAIITDLEQIPELI
jgi:putative hydrolase of the HAD superfamily